MTKKTYEYAGFIYEVEEKPERVKLTPAPGQHPAAGKAKHLHNALECYLQDNKK